MYFPMNIIHKEIPLILITSTAYFWVRFDESFIFNILVS